MKIGVLSDTHLVKVNPRLREIVNVYFAETDMIIHAGDLVAVDVLQYLQGLDLRGSSLKHGNLEAVHGNMDHPDVRNLLPRKRVITVGPFRIGLIHGWGSPSGIEERIKDQFQEVQCIVFGHTHNPVNRWKDGILFFNPGSPTDKRYARDNSVGILEIGNEISGNIIPLQ